MSRCYEEQLTSWTYKLGVGGFICNSRSEAVRVSPAQTFRGAVLKFDTNELGMDRFKTQLRERGNVGLYLVSFSICLLNV